MIYSKRSWKRRWTPLHSLLISIESGEPMEVNLCTPLPEPLLQSTGTNSPVCNGSRTKTACNIRKREKTESW